MPSLRQEIAELKRRLIALEARQLMWRHDAAAVAVRVLPTAGMARRLS